MNKFEIKKNIFALVEDFFKINEDTTKDSKIGVAFPVFDHNEVNSALDSLLNLDISQGKKVKKFEESFSKYVGSDYGIAVNSGSSANLLAISALIEAGYVKRGSEVIVPAATFTTVISPIIQCGLKPVFVDIQDDTYNIDPAKIEQAINSNTGLIMPVHSLGCPADMEAIMEIAEERNICVFEDCCEAHGSSINNKKIGSYGILSAFSFFVAHNMTSGEGGMVMTNDSKLAKIMRSMREFGRFNDNMEGRPRFDYNDDYLKDYDERYVFEKVGFNIRMTDIAASLGIEQLKKLDKFNDIRVKNADALNKALEKFKTLQLPKYPKRFFHSFYGYTIVLNEDANYSRKELVNHLENNGIETRAFMGGDLTKQPAYRKFNFKIVGGLSVTEKITKNAFFIGCHPKISSFELNKIIDVFDDFFKDK